MTRSQPAFPVVWTSFFLVVVLIVALARVAWAVPAFEFGVSLDNTVVAGSVVHINAALRNTGDQSIVFAPHFIGGLPSVQGGSLPGASVSRGGGDWSILDQGFFFGPVDIPPGFLTQFAGITVLPGATFDFVFGTFTAPSNQPLGSSSQSTFSFGIDLTDDIRGSTLLGGTNLPNFDDRPTVTFTIGTNPSTSPLAFIPACVVDHSRRTILSGPAECGFAPVPMPSTFFLLASCISLVVWVERRAKAKR